MRKAILYIALSLDGYIADSKGGIGWLDELSENHPGDYGYREFVSGVDTVVMGYNTYRQIAAELSPSAWPYAGMESYVLTHRAIADTADIRFVNRPAQDLISALKRREGKAIWICGGANVIHQLTEQDCIDEYRLTIMPLLLGQGIRLFGEQEKRVPLTLVSCVTENGAVNCVYRKSNR